MNSYNINYNYKNNHYFTENFSNFQLTSYLIIFDKLSLCYMFMYIIASTYIVE